MQRRRNQLIRRMERGVFSLALRVARLALGYPVLIVELRVDPRPALN
jgi:hypothetical protein